MQKKLRIVKLMKELSVPKQNMLTVYVVDVFLFDPNNVGDDGKSSYKALGKAGITIINKPAATPNPDSNASNTSSNQKVLVLYRSKQETLAAAPIAGEQFVFDIQNETYGCFYTLGKTQQKV